MKRFTRQLQEASKNILLTVPEKTLMRESLCKYMEYKPLRSTEIKNTRTRRGAQGFRVPLFSFFRVHHLSWALIIALTVTSGTYGISSAAVDALPGDLLYPVKVNINEEVETLLLDSPEEEISWEQERAERRLDEAGKLASEGRLDTKKKEQVAKLFAEHTDAVVSKMREVQKVDPVLAAEVSDDLERSLDTHEVVLARLMVEKSDTVDTDARELVEQVHAVAATAGKIRESAEEQLLVNDSSTVATDTIAAQDSNTSTTSTNEGGQKKDSPSGSESPNLRERAAYRAKDRAGASLARVEEMIKKLDQTSELATQAKARVEMNKETVLAGEQALAANEYGRAYGAYRQASSVFNTISKLLEVADLFSIEIYTTDSESSYSTTTEESDADSVAEDDRVAELNALHANVEVLLRRAHAKLLTNNAYEQEDADRANALIKDAAASMLRAEIALVRGEEKQAETLLNSANESAQRALDIIHVDPNTAVEATSTPDNREGPEEASSSVTIYHTYRDGIHVFRGLIAATSCSELVATTTSNEMGISLEIGFSTTTNDLTCSPVPVTNLFEARAESTSSPTLLLVTIDGIERAFNIVEGDMSTPLGDNVETTDEQGGEQDGTQ